MWRQFPARAVCWFDLEAGAGVCDDGRRVTTVPRPSVGVLLDSIPPGIAIVNLTGGRPGAGPDGFHAWSEAPAGWVAAGHFLKRLTMPILRYAAIDPSGRDNLTRTRTLEVQRAAAWFGDGDYTPDQCRAAMAIVAELVGERCGPGAMRVRPAATGQELFLRKVPAGGWPCVDLEVAGLIRSTSGQGRIEAFTPAAAQLERLVEYDGRFMYAALCRELPAGPYCHGSGDGGHDRYARGRYRCEWQVPHDWTGPGLLPAKSDDGVSWVYPRRPGERAAGWVDAVELDLARRHGWAPAVTEHLVWPYRARPLDGWARSLIDARDGVRLRALAHGVDLEVADLARAAIRAICLFGLGAFYGRPYMLTHTVDLGAGARLPDDAQNVRIDGGRVTYETESTRGGPQLAHPEWPATVWARCRARMLAGPGGTGALAVPPDDLVAIHTDALYLAADPHWSDDGDPGRLRHKATWRGPWPWPSSDAELTRHIRALRKGRP